MVDAAGVGYEVHDDGAGNLVGDTGGASTINYLTGAYVIVFAAVPAAGTYVKSSSYAYTASRPDSVLFYDTHFTLRPVPDGVYQVTLNARIRPTEFLNNAAQQPDLDEWAQYIAFGTAKKIYEDRFDMESVQALMPSFKEQEQLCLRRTIMQQRDQRAASQYNTMEKGHYWWNIWL
jgi:hypothetical protein